MIIPRLIIAICLVSSLCFALEPNPPYFPSSVYVFSPNNPSYTQSVVDRVFATNGGTNPPFNGQFVEERYAFLFLPGYHNVNINIGYYTSVMGLGNTPQDTYIGSVRVTDGDSNGGGALDNFWRSAENFATGYTLWATSQACPMRRVFIKGNLDLSQSTSSYAGYASGGFLADSIVTGTINSGDQQQFLTRNTQMGAWIGGVWNMVFVGNSGGVPSSHCSNNQSPPFTTVATTPIIAEKPYIAYQNGYRFVLRVPKIENNKIGPTTNFDNVEEIDFSNVYVANATDSAATINAKLSQGLHLVLTPGIYNLTESIIINNPNTIVFGIGFPTLISKRGTPVITANVVDGVRLVGVLISAGQLATPVLLKWGQPGTGSQSNPSFLYDVFARVGGINDPSKYQVQADVVVQIDSDFTVVDNSWNWRADHGISGLVYNSQNPSYNGLIVNGNDVTIYGLALEHHLKDQLLWNGERGRVYFYQSELPYDVNQQNFGNPGFTGYRVANNVNEHSGWGIGVYTYFRDASVTVQSAIVTPNNPGITFVAPFTRWLNGKGQVNHVWNDKGDAVNVGNRLAYVC